MSQEDPMNGEKADDGGGGQGMPIPADVMTAFFTGDQRQIQAAIVRNMPMLRNMVGQLPRDMRRQLMDDDDGAHVVNADEINGDAPASYADDDVDDAPRPRRAAPARRAPSEDEHEVEEIDLDSDPDGEGEDVDSDPIQLMNNLGRGIGALIGALPGVGLGITFHPGGRHIDVAFYYPPTQRGGSAEVLAKRSGHVARFGDAIDVAYADAEQLVRAEIEDDGEDDDIDEDLAEGDEG